MQRLNARFKLWLSSKDVEGAFGDGKWRLLKAVAAEGSLRAASDMLKISYRKAWGDLKKAEEALGIALVQKERGGSGGGGSGLTAEGERWVRAYERFRAEIEKVVEKAYSKHIRGLGK
ncbi:MAG TPA: LysR family transcriptional regulator [Sedimentisphaerales bacterium]|nr:LysR family transcriptional regulator [Sedimentisphaerales bacterium]